MSSFAGSFLVARTVLQDPNFRQTVVLLLEHGGAAPWAWSSTARPRRRACRFRFMSAVRARHRNYACCTARRTGRPARRAKASLPASTAATPPRSRRDGRTRDGADAVPHLRGLRRLGPGASWKASWLPAPWTLTPANGALLFQTPVEELWERLVPPRLPQPSLN